MQAWPACPCGFLTALSGLPALPTPLRLLVPVVGVVMAQ